MEEIQQAEKDFLTGFYTRGHLVSAILKKVVYAKLHHERFSLLLVDIDHFKEINDKYGHLWGDEFLKYVSSTLRLTLEDKGSIFRYGGDEFVVLFSSPESKEAFLLSKRFNQVMRNRPFLFQRRLFHPTISCGLATYPDNGEGAEDLLKAADQALYFSKKYGRNTTTHASKIRLYKLRMILVVLLELFLLVAFVCFGNIYLLKGARFKDIAKPIKRLFPVGVKGDTKIILKSGEVILGRIISEDQDRLIVQASFEQGNCVLDIEKPLIHSLVRMMQEDK